MGFLSGIFSGVIGGSAWAFAGATLIALLQLPLVILSFPLALLSGLLWL